MARDRKGRAAQLTTRGRSLSGRLNHITSTLSELSADLAPLLAAQPSAELERLHDSIKTVQGVMDVVRGQLVTLRAFIKQGNLDEAEQLCDTVAQQLDAEGPKLTDFRLALAGPRKNSRWFAVVFSGDPGGGDYHSLSLERAVLALLGLVNIRRNQDEIREEAQRLDAELTRLRAIYTHPPYNPSDLTAQALLLWNRLRACKEESDRLHYGE